jgi:hypothetical protein
MKTVTPQMKRALPFGEGAPARITTTNTHSMRNERGNQRRTGWRHVSAIIPELIKRIGGVA